MRFIRDDKAATPLVDTIFKIGAMAKKRAGDKDANVYNAVVGSLYDENGKIFSYKSVFDVYNSIPNELKTRYASAFSGNSRFKKAIEEWIFQKESINLPHFSFATTGGTGALNVTISNLNNKGGTLIVPSIGWVSYEIMAEELGLKVAKYNMFKDGKFDLDNVKETIKNVLIKEGKTSIIINDPCHNPTGYCMSDEEWVKVIDICNELTEYGEIVIINDVAYIDYSKDFDSSRHYMKAFNNINEKVAVVITFSCSKTFTFYGMRVGAAEVITKDPVDNQNIFNAFEKSARATWSNVNNAAMICCSMLLNENNQDFKRELDAAAKLLNKRAEIFINEAKEVGLPTYPFVSGFFVTLDIQNQEILPKFYDALLANDIFTVKYKNGIRIALCSLPINKCVGLARRMKEIYDSVL